MKRDLSKLTNQTFDVAIIGGGIYGAFTAWDAALRGLSVALVEAQDFCGGTSANSQKIIHGGFRYLQHGDFKRMRESIRERKNLMKIAPHLIHPLPVLVPAYGHGLRGREVLSLALRMYDLISLDLNQGMDVSKEIPRGKVLSRDEVIQISPHIPSENLTGAGIFYDAYAYNSERFVISILRSAEKMGACLANYVRAIGFIRGKKSVTGIECQNHFGGEKFAIQAKMIVNTSGPWIDQVLGLLDPHRIRPPLVKCFNVITRMLFKGYAVGLYGKSQYQDEKALLDKGTRLFFVTPWRNHSVVGTSISERDGNPDNLTATSDEIQKFLSEFNLACPGFDLKVEDVSFVHCGFLPSAKRDSKTKDAQILKRYHIIDHRKDGLDGLVSVVGVKYTTARDVAQKVIDHLFTRWGKTRPRSTSAITPVYGGEIEDWGKFLDTEIKKKPFNLNEELLRPLLYNYGSAYREVLEKLDSSNDQERGLLKAEVIHGVRHEMALKLLDIVLRRTELGTAEEPKDELLKECAEVMGCELGWDREKIQNEIAEVKAFYRFSN